MTISPGAAAGMLIQQFYIVDIAQVLCRPSLLQLAGVQGGRGLHQRHSAGFCVIGGSISNAMKGEVGLLPEMNRTLAMLSVNICSMQIVSTIRRCLHLLGSQSLDFVKR